MSGVPDEETLTHLSRLGLTGALVNEAYMWLMGGNLAVVPEFGG